MDAHHGVFAFPSHPQAPRILLSLTSSVMGVPVLKRKLFRLAAGFCWMISASTTSLADEPAANATNATPETATLDQQRPDATGPPPPPKWEFNAFVDAAYLLDFNHPANHLFR